MYHVRNAIHDIKILACGIIIATSKFNIMDNNKFNDEQLSQIFGDWYNSTQGPGLSRTLVSIVAGIIPVAALIISTKSGSQVDPTSLNVLQTNAATFIYAVVYAIFTIRAIVTHVQAKKTLQAKFFRLSASLNKGVNSCTNCPGCSSNK